MQVIICGAGQVGFNIARYLASESADEEHVSIRFNNYSDSSITLQPMADEHCASYDRIAIYQTTTFGDGVIGFLTGLPLHAEFECRA